MTRRARSWAGTKRRGGNVGAACRSGASEPEGTDGIFFGSGWYACQAAIPAALVLCRQL